MALLSGYSRGDGCGFLQKEPKPVFPSSLTYDDNQIFITKLLDKLEEIWNHIESKKDEMEMICKENKRLLKPLPKQIVEKEEKREESEKYLPSSEVPFESEIEDLNLINKVLEKAQKTRKKHQNKTGGDSRHVDEKICEGSLNDKRKPESVSDNSQNLGTSQMTVDPSQIGVISEKELTKALLNVRVSKSKTTHQKAPYKTMDSECRKVMPNKNQSKCSSQGNVRSRFHVTKSLDHPKDDAIPSLKNKSSSGSFKEKKPQCLRKTSKLEEQDIIESVTNENRNSPLYVIPPEIKDLCRQNQRLKKMAYKVKKKDDSKFSRSFLQLWEKKMTKTPNNELKLVTEKYNKLFTLLQSLNLTSISDSSSPEEIFEMKIALEYILTSMYDLNEQTKRLLKKAKSQLRVDDDITPEMEEFKLYPNVPQEIWLPSPSLQLLDSHFFDCWTNSSSLKLNYSSLEELDRYWNQHHKLQESLLSQYLIKIIFQSFLPILKSQYLQQREKMFLYRFLSGFLHHNGKHFPVLIES